MPIYNNYAMESQQSLEQTTKIHTMNVLETTEHEVEIKRKLEEELKKYQEATSNEDAVEKLVVLRKVTFMLKLKINKTLGIITHSKGFHAGTQPFSKPFNSAYSYSFTN